MSKIEVSDCQFDGFFDDFEMIDYYEAWKLLSKEERIEFEKILEKKNPKGYLKFKEEYLSNP